MGNRTWCHSRAKPWREAALFIQLGRDTTIFFYSALPKMFVTCQPNSIIFAWGMWLRLCSKALYSAGTVNQMQPYHTTFFCLTQGLLEVANIQKKTPLKAETFWPWLVPPVWGGLTARLRDHHMEVTTGLIQTTVSCVPLYSPDCLSGGYVCQLAHQKSFCVISPQKCIFSSFSQGNSSASLWADSLISSFLLVCTSSPCVTAVPAEVLTALYLVHIILTPKRSPCPWSNHHLPQLLMGKNSQSG